jgi:hypothetical protein
MLSREPCQAAQKSPWTGTRIRITGMHLCGGRSRVPPLSRSIDRDPLLRVEYEDPPVIYDGGCDGRCCNLNSYPGSSGMARHAAGNGVQVNRTGK